MGDLKTMGDAEASLIGERRLDSPPISVTSWDEESNNKMALDKATSTPSPQEKELLDKQLQFNDTEASFFGLYRHASWFDIILVGISTISALISGVLHPTAPIANAYLFEFFARIPSEGDAVAPLINQFSLYYVYFFFISLASWTIGTAGFIYTASRIARRIKIQYFAAVLRQNIAVFDDAGTGGILSHLTSDANMIQEALSSKLAISINALGNLLGTIVVCFALDWNLAFILSWSFVVGSVVLYLTGKATVGYSSRALEASSAGTTVVEEALGAIKTTVALGMQKHVHKTYVEYLQRASKNGFVLKTLSSSMLCLCIASGYINVGLGFWLGAKRLTEGVTPFTHIVTIAIVFKSAAFCILNVGSNLESFNMAVAAASRIYRMTRRESPIDSGSDSGTVPDQVGGTIEIRNIKHIYPGRQTVTVLDNISIKFPAGKTTAIVGPSGSGKSSIASLILRFYDPVAGDIYLDNENINTLQLQWLRQQIHFVSQEPFLFNKTIYENIEAGLAGPQWDNVSEKEKRQLVYKSAKAAQAHEFIEKLPQGYDTMIGARASRLSGGQAQRLAIARALVGQPRILILDEATSALDSETEAKVLASMGKHYKDCSKIVIAHRLSTIRDADNIVVLRSGRVVEEGTHRDLMEKCSDYFDLVQAQELSPEDSAMKSSEEKVESDASVGDAFTGEKEKKETNDNNETLFVAEEELDNRIQSSSVWSLIKFGWRLNRPEIWWVVVGLLCSLIAGFEEPMSAILFGKTITSISQPLTEASKILSETTLYSRFFYLLAVVMFIVVGAEGIIFGWCSEKMMNRARSMALEKILRMEVSFFDKKGNSAGALANFLSTSVTDLAGVSGSALSIILICASTTICGIAVALVYGWKLTVVCFYLFPLQVISGYLSTSLVGDFEMHTEIFNSEAAEFASESLSGIRTIAAMTTENKVLNEFKGTLRASTTRALRANLQTSSLYALAQAIYYGGMAFTFWYGGKLIMRNEYSMDQFIVVQCSMLFSSYSAGLFFSWTPSIQKAKRASAMLQHLVDRNSTIDPLGESTSAKLGKPKGKIDFENVSFFYPSRPDTAALKDVSFSIAAGSNVAFVGATGSGKSTIISMIERFYDPSQGTVSLDGNPLNSLQVSEYRQLIGLVDQDPVLYNGTIESNLLAGLDDEQSESPSRMSMEEACKQANIYGFIKALPDGFNTAVGNRGTQLSVGQKQRIALARALIRQPTILLLDEATSALDSQSETLILDALEKGKESRTTITVAHRLSTIIKADRIYVLDQGIIVEAGTHAQLMAKRGRYYGLYTASTGGQV
ncbi:multidrug resistance protein [Trichoderma pleuroticola]